MALETKIAEASWPLAERRDPDKTYNAVSLAELEALAPGFAWRPFLAGADLSGAQQVVVGEKSAFPRLAAIYASTPVETLKAWAAFQAGDNAAPYLSKPFDDAWFELHGRTLNGQQTQAPRWKRAVRAVSGGNGQSFERVDVFGNLGWAVGGVIGHELTHGFDDQGRKFDADGKLRDWWAPQDAKVFDERARRLGAQYAAFEPLPGMRVNAELTMGENIADLGGVTLALEAYRRSLNGKPAPVLNGLSGDQRVFLGWAQAWRGSLRQDALKKQVTSDPHSPRPFRVNGPTRNIDDWYAAFGVTPGEKMYLAPHERVRIW